MPDTNVPAGPLEVVSNVPAGPLEVVSNVPAGPLEVVSDVTSRQVPSQTSIWELQRRAKSCTK